MRGSAGFIIACLLVLVSTSALAGKVSKIHTTEAVAMGYADIAFSGPAAGALDRPRDGFRAISVDVRGTLSEGLQVVDWIDNVQDFKDGFGGTILDALKSVDALKRIVESSGWTLGAEARMDFLRFTFAGSKLGYLAVGAYAESSVGVKVVKPDIDRIAWRGDHIDIGSKYEALKAKGWADGGVALEYGRPFELSHGMRLGVGIRHKIFHRLDIPEHVIVFQRDLYNEDDIDIPDFSYSRGWGFGTDLFASLDIGDRYIGTRVSVEARNTPTTTVWIDEKGVRDMILIGAGVSIHPLRWAGYDVLLMAFDLEVFEDGTSAVHMGTSYRLGNQRFHFTPSIGSALLGRDVWGDPYHSLTVGFSAKIAVLELAGVFEYRGEGRYDAGARIAVGW